MPQWVVGTRALTSQSQNAKRPSESGTTMIDMTKSRTYTLRVDVLVTLVLLRRPSTVDHIAEVAVANIVILMASCKIVLRKL